MNLLRRTSLCLLALGASAGIACGSSSSDASGEGDDSTTGTGDGAASGGDGGGGGGGGLEDAGAGGDAGPLVGARLGAYRWGAGSTTPGVGGPSAHGTYEQWLGNTVPFALDFMPDTNWAQQEGQSWALGPWGTWVKARAGNTLVYTVQMVLSDGSNTLATCAAGTDNPHWKALATNLVAAGLGGSILRLGHEFNGNWYPWNAVGRQATYIGCFQQMVTTMRAVSGASFRFDWCSSSGVQQVAAETAYPGDSYVDIVGLDIYDVVYGTYGYPKTTAADAGPDGGDLITDAERETGWSSLLTGDHNLNFWRDFAKAHSKPMSIPEWGTWTEAGGEPGGGDDTVYVQNMHDFVADPANNVLYASYFDVHASDGDHQLSPGVVGEYQYGPTKFPRAAALFQKIFAH
jgi:hypothetical protein